MVIALPEDMLVEAAAVADAPRYAPIDAAPSVGQLADLEQLLARPPGPSPSWAAPLERAGRAQFAAFAERHALPTSCRSGARCFPADHPCYIGDVGLGINPALLKRVADADLILLVGGASENPSQALLDIPAAPEAGPCASRQRRAGARPPRWRSIPRPPLSPRRWPA